MHVPLRLQCALVAVALWSSSALAQSVTSGNGGTDAAILASEPPAAPAGAAAPLEHAGPSSLLSTTDGAIPPAELATDPIPVASAAPGALSSVTSTTDGPTASAATAGIRLHAATEGLSRQDLADRATHQGGVGTDGALMIVGGAAFIAGLIVGGGGGTALAIGGAAIGLYGLYLYLR